MIGSDFGLEVPQKKYCNIKNDIGNFKLFYTQLGRDAIKAVLSLVPFTIKQVLLPSYLCDSVYNIFKEYNIKRYEIDGSFKANLDEKAISDNCVVFINNYFGLSNENNLISTINNERKHKQIFVIYDITHSLFNSNNFNLNVDCLVASLRKWCAIPDGGFLAYKSNACIESVDCDLSFVNGKIEAMIMKKSFLDTHTGVYKDFKIKFDSSEEKADNPFSQSIKRISPFSLKMLEYFDYESILYTRRKNFIQLLQSVNFEYAYPCFGSLRDKMAPLCFPIYSNERDSLRKFLIGKEVYCPIHWRGDNINGQAKTISEKILSIPIDQRYGEAEMDYIVKCLKEFAVCLK